MFPVLSFWDPTTGVGFEWTWGSVVVGGIRWIRLPRGFFFFFLIAVESLGVGRGGW